MRRLLGLLVLGLAIGAGAVLGWRLLRAPAPLPDPPAVALRIREVARLETLEVVLYKKISYEPEPRPAGSLGGDLVRWARHALARPRGKVIVFGKARLGLDLERIGPSSLRVAGREAFVVLPPLEVKVELEPDETEVIGSNLDSAETAELFALAKRAMEREVESDAALGDKARASAERAIRGLLRDLGFAEVHFVERLPGVPSG